LNYIVDRMRAAASITPTQLADELNVSERTIYRDLRSLEKRDTLQKRYSRREGRYLLESELMLAPFTFTPSEALALRRCAISAALLNRNFQSADLLGAVSKLNEALCAAAPACLDPGSATAGAIQRSALRPAIEMVRRAIRLKRKLVVRYWATTSRADKAIVVSPYEVRLVKEEWILLAKVETGEIHAFPMERVRPEELLPDRFRFPRQFRADLWFDRAGYDEAEQERLICVRFSPRAAETVQKNCGDLFRTVRRLQDGSVECALSVLSTGEVLWWLLSFGEDVEAISPAGLRNELRQAAEAILSIYAGESGPALQLQASSP
ncbi:MAG TPA: WYL domain-containing protein, partial [Chthonomonadales bacterium]|nr:WYL domain-containing protein [Chthonomonadales bacterium]